jgi:hypothetical protein
MNYELKDKIVVSKEFLNELEMKGWQEIEHLQSQIANIAEGPQSNKLRQLLKNLLTSYYVFTGSIEALANSPAEQVETPVDTPIEETKLDEISLDEPEITLSTDDFTAEVSSTPEVEDPFEYFVDFDEPVGEPLTDDDLYN